MNADPFLSSSVKKTKNVHHSLEKENQDFTLITPAPMPSPKDIMTSSHSALLKKNKMLFAVKTQMNEFNTYKSCDKLKSKKSIKTKDLPSFEKDSSASELFPFRESTNRKKDSYVKSDV